MAGDAFDRSIFNPVERPYGSDINRAQTWHDRALREVFRQFFGGQTVTSSIQPNSFPLARAAFSPRNGFIGDAFKARPTNPPSLAFDLTPGIGFIDNPDDTPSGIEGVNGLDDLCPYKPLILPDPLRIYILQPLPSAGMSRVDTVEVRANRHFEDITTREPFNPETNRFEFFEYSTLAFESGDFGVVRAPSLSTAGISYVVGAPGVSPVMPNVTPGYIRVAAINLVSAQPSVLVVTDTRYMLTPYDALRASLRVEVNNSAKTSRVLSLAAPPGVLATTFTDVAADASGNTIQVYFFAGVGNGVAGAFTGQSSVAQLEFQTVPYAFVRKNFTLGVATAADVAAVAGASPALPISVGQPFLKLTIKTGNPPSSTYTLSVFATIMR